MRRPENDPHRERHPPVARLVVSIIAFAALGWAPGARAAEEAATAPAQEASGAVAVIRTELDRLAKAAGRPDRDAASLRRDADALEGRLRAALRSARSVAEREALGALLERLQALRVGLRPQRPLRPEAAEAPALVRDAVGPKPSVKIDNDSFFDQGARRNTGELSGGGADAPGGGATLAAAAVDARAVMEARGVKVTDKPKPVPPAPPPAPAPSLEDSDSLASGLAAKLKWVPFLPESLRKKLETAAYPAERLRLAEALARETLTLLRGFTGEAIEAELRAGLRREADAFARLPTDARRADALRRWQRRSAELIARLSEIPEIRGSADAMAMIDRWLRARADSIDVHRGALRDGHRVEARDLLIASDAVWFREAGRKGTTQADASGTLFLSDDGNYMEFHPAGRPEKHVRRGKPGKLGPTEVFSTDTATPWTKKVYDDDGRLQKTELRDGSLLLDISSATAPQGRGATLGSAVEAVAASLFATDPPRNAREAKSRKALITNAVGSWIRLAETRARDQGAAALLEIGPKGSLTITLVYRAGGREIQRAAFDDASAFFGDRKGRALVVTMPIRLNASGRGEESAKRWREYLDNGGWLQWTEVAVDDARKRVRLGLHDPSGGRVGTQEDKGVIVDPRVPTRLGLNLRTGAELFSAIGTTLNDGANHIPGLPWLVKTMGDGYHGWVANYQAYFARVYGEPLPGHMNAAALRVEAYINRGNRDDPRNRKPRTPGELKAYLLERETGARSSRDPAYREACQAELDYIDFVWRQGTIAELASKGEDAERLGAKDWQEKVYRRLTTADRVAALANASYFGVRSYADRPTDSVGLAGLAALTGVGLSTAEGLPLALILQGLNTARAIPRLQTYRNLQKTLGITQKTAAIYDAAEDSSGAVSSGLGVLTAAQAGDRTGLINQALASIQQLTFALFDVKMAKAVDAKPGNGPAKTGRVARGGGLDSGPAGDSRLLGATAEPDGAHLIQERYGYGAANAAFARRMARAEGAAEASVRRRLAGGLPLDEAFLRAELDRIARARHEIAVGAAHPDSEPDAYGLSVPETAAELALVQASHPALLPGTFKSARVQDFIGGERGARHAAFLPRAREALERGPASVEIRGRRVPLTYFVEIGDGALMAVHPSFADMKVLRDEGLRILAEATNARLPERAYTERLARAYFLLMHGQPYLNGSPAIVETMMNALLRARYGKSLPPKTGEPFWDAMFSDGSGFDLFRSRKAVDARPGNGLLETPAQGARPPPAHAVANAARMDAATEAYLAERGRAYPEEPKARDFASRFDAVEFPSDAQRRATAAAAIAAHQLGLEPGSIEVLRPKSEPRSGATVYELFSGGRPLGVFKVYPALRHRSRETGAETMMKELAGLRLLRAQGLEKSELIDALGAWRLQQGGADSGEYGYLMTMAKGPDFYGLFAELGRSHHPDLAAKLEGYLDNTAAAVAELHAKTRSGDVSEQSKRQNIKLGRDYLREVYRSLKPRSTEARMLGRVLDEYERLAERYLKANLPAVVTHTDFHLGNITIDPETGRPTFIDYDMSMKSRGANGRSGNFAPVVDISKFNDFLEMSNETKGLGLTKQELDRYTAHFLESYQRHAGLTGEERAAFADAIAFSELRNLATALKSARTSEIPKFLQKVIGRLDAAAEPPAPDEAWRLLRRLDRVDLDFNPFDPTLDLGKLSPAIRERVAAARQAQADYNALARRAAPPPEGFAVLYHGESTDRIQAQGGVMSLYSAKRRHNGGDGFYATTQAGYANWYNGHGWNAEGEPGDAPLLMAIHVRESEIGDVDTLKAEDEARKRSQGDPSRYFEKLTEVIGELCPPDKKAVRLHHSTGEDLGFDEIVIRDPSLLLRPGAVKFLDPRSLGPHPAIRGLKLATGAFEGIGPRGPPQGAKAP
ncbi:MAG: phosphotransferase [Elusimicrobia bacterium]|nr:phosphotransferase [Elusimicrobiota bacterium]